MATPVKQFIFAYNSETDKKVCDLLTNIIAEKIYNSNEVQEILKNQKSKDMC
jgi:hypothetical protein